MWIIFKKMFYWICYGIASVTFFFWGGAKKQVGSLYPDQRPNLNPYFGRRSLNHWIAREVPAYMLFPRLPEGTFYGESLCFVLCVKWWLSSEESACQCSRRKSCGFGPLGREEPLEEEMAIHSRILAWEIPRTERSLAGYSPQGHRRAGRDSVTEPACTRLLLESVSRWGICEWTPLLSALT